MIKTYLSELRAKIRLLPTDLKWLFWFSAPLSFLCALAMVFAHNRIYEEIIPYTGWSPEFPYFLVAILVIQKTSLETNESNLANFKSIRYKVVYFLGIYLIKGIYDWFEKTPEFYTDTNPYLRYDPYRPIYAICLPLFWMLIIGWPLMKDFFRKKSKALA